MAFWFRGTILNARSMVRGAQPTGRCLTREGCAEPAPQYWVLRTK
jgi:hypothetical protein